MRESHRHLNQTVEFIRKARVNVVNASGVDCTWAKTVATRARVKIRIVDKPGTERQMLPVTYSETNTFAVSVDDNSYTRANAAPARIAA